jgi:AcrR family transcriptional regulator
MADAVAGIEDPLERFRRLGVAYVRYAVTHPAHFRVMFSSELLRSRDTPELRAAGQPTLEALVSALERVQANGTFMTGDPRALSLPAWSMVHGLATLIVDGQLPALLDDPGAADALADEVIDVVIRGLSDRPSRARPRRRS